MNASNKYDAIMCMRELCCEKIEKAYKTKSVSADMRMLWRCNDIDTTFSTQRYKS